MGWGGVVVGAARYRRRRYGFLHTVPQDPAATGDDVIASAGQLAARFEAAFLALLPAEAAALGGAALAALFQTGHHPALFASERTAPPPTPKVGPPAAGMAPIWASAPTQRALSHAASRSACSADATAAT